MIDWTKRIRQKNGRAARFIGQRVTGGDRPYLVDILSSGGQWFVEFYSEEGETTLSHLALENIFKGIVLYQNVYSNGGTGVAHRTLQGAREAGRDNRVGIIKITLEDERLVNVEIVND